MNGARLARLHASLIQQAARGEAISRRLQHADPARSECESVDAQEARAAAADLADVMIAAGLNVLRVTDPRQLALLSDGYSGGIDG